MSDTQELDAQIRELPCDAKLVYVVLEKRGPFTEEEIMKETYLTKDETVYALAVLEEENLVESHEDTGADGEIYEAQGK